MTIKLYYNNPYITEFTSEVSEIKQVEDKYHIVLKETGFYPEGGGQPCDLGEIQGIKVEYVYEEDEKIYHVLNKLIERTIVFCKIDFNRRFDHMQQHSGEHLLSGAFFKLYGGKNLGFHLGVDYVTIDISLPEVSKEMVEKAEKMCNEVIIKNIPIKCYVVNKDQLSSVPIRKETSVTQDIRIVEIEKTDYSACCGTHVNNTCEIGLLKIIKVEKYKGNSRIYFKCGHRALKDYEKKHEIVADLVKLLSAEELSITAKIDNMNKIIKDNNKAIADLKRQICEFHVEAILKELKQGTYKKLYEDKSFDEVSEIGKLLVQENIDVLIGSSKENMILLASKEDSKLDCGKIFKASIKSFNGKGGGSKNRAQGSFNSKEELLEYYNFLNSEIENI